MRADSRGGRRDRLLHDLPARAWRWRRAATTPAIAPVWFDDLDLTISIRRLGYKVFFMPDVRVIHQARACAAASGSPRGSGSSATLRLARFLLPPRGRLRVVQALNLDRPPTEHGERLAHHYAYWRQKWGFDMLNPDMEAVRDRWGDTEICWRHNPEMLEAGRRIVAAYESRRAAPDRQRRRPPARHRGPRARRGSAATRMGCSVASRRGGERGGELVVLRRRGGGGSPFAGGGAPPDRRFLRRPPLPRRAVELVEQGSCRSTCCGSEAASTTRSRSTDPARSAARRWS